jgi:hypothetical protein
MRASAFGVVYFKHFLLTMFQHGRRKGLLRDFAGGWPEGHRELPHPTEDLAKWLDRTRAFGLTRSIVTISLFNLRFQPAVDVVDGLRQTPADSVDSDGRVVDDLEDHPIALAVKAAVVLKRRSKLVGASVWILGELSVDFLEDEIPDVFGKRLKIRQGIIGESNGEQLTPRGVLLPWYATGRLSRLA